MKNLFEEIRRIKSLIVYEHKVDLTEVSTSSVDNENKSSVENSSEKDNEDNTLPNKGINVVDKNDCFIIKATGRFVVNVPTGSKAVENFIIELRNVIDNNPEYKKGFDSGTMYIRDITLQGFASNYYGGSVEPKFGNGYCKKWSVPLDSGYGGICTDFEFKSFNGKKLNRYTGDGTTNNKLANDRAVNLFNSMKTTLEKEGKSYGVKLDPTVEPKYIDGGSIYTKDNVDEQWKSLISSGKLNPGQIVAITAKVCYTLKEPCPDNCMEKDESGNCNCPEGMTYNESTKQCECPKGSKKTENCECKKVKPVECLDKCQKPDENGNCKCPKGMKFNEETKKCDCLEGKIKPFPEACNCVTPKPSIKCNSSIKKEGTRGLKRDNFVAATVKSEFPAGEGDTVTISFDSLVVPDAFYVKYGDQEFFSGFMGEVYNIDFLQNVLTIPERKKMLKIQSKEMKDFIQKELSKGDEDYSSMDYSVRNFVGELVIYKREDQLLERINAAIKSVGGKLTVNNIFKDGDAEAEAITDEIINTGNLKDNINRYKPIMKTGTSFKIQKETENFKVIVLVFSPLQKTMFNMEVKCE